MALDKGWVFFAYEDGEGGGNEFQVQCEGWDYDDSDKGAKVIITPNRGRFGYTINKRDRVLKIYNLFVRNYADWNLLKIALKALEDTGTVINIRIQVKTTGEFEKWDGTNQTIPVIIFNRKGHKKPYRGDAQFYRIGMVMCKQAGVLTA